MYSDDKDFKQKIKMQKVFWSMGMWSRIDIPIVIYEDDSQRGKIKKHYLTDIDVYSEIIQKDFSIEKSIADCKSGSNVKIFERLFWVRGVKEYFGASQAYLVKKSISSKAKIFMPKLDIIGVDNQTLFELEKIYHTNALPLYSEKYYFELDKIIQEYENEYKKIFDYLVTRYWFTESNVSMKVLLSMLAKRGFYKTLDKNNRNHRFLLMEVCIMFARTVLSCCRYVLTRDVLNLEQSIMEYIHGGVDGFNLKMNMVRDIHNELKDVLYNVQLADSILIQPSYYKELVKLVAVILGEANNMTDILRYMEIMQHEIVLGEKFDYNQCMGNEYSSIGHKLAKDIVLFYLKENNISVNFFADIFNV